MATWKKSTTSPKTGLQYLQLLKHFRDKPGFFGKGAQGRLTLASEIAEQKGMGSGGHYDLAEEKAWRKKHGKTKKLNLDEKFVKWEEKNKPGDQNYGKKFITWAKKNAPEIVEKIGRLGPKALLVSTGVGGALSPFLDAKEVAAADDPMSDILRGQAESRERIGSSLDFNRGGMVKKYYSHGSKVKKKKTKKKQNGNDIVASFYKGFK